MPTPCSIPSLVSPKGAPMPRILTALLRGFDESYCSAGASCCRRPTLKLPVLSIWSPPTTEMAIGTSCAVSARRRPMPHNPVRSEEHTSELQSLMRISYAVFCLKKNNKNNQNNPDQVSKRHTTKTQTPHAHKSTT